MRWSTMVLCLMALTMVTGCISLKFGRDFPSPEAKSIVAGKTDKASLERMFGAPYQVGLDSGDQMWRWVYRERELRGEVGKDPTLPFHADGNAQTLPVRS